MENIRLSNMPIIASKGLEKLKINKKARFFVFWLCNLLTAGQACLKDCGLRDDRRSKAL